MKHKQFQWSNHCAENHNSRVMNDIEYLSTSICNVNITNGGCVMNWRDYTAILSIIFIAIATVGILLGVPAVHITDWRLATVLLTILGLLVFFAISPVFASTSKPESIVTVLLGMSALIIAFTSLVVSNQLLFVLLCINLIILWGVTTYYHIQAHRNHMVHRGNLYEK